MYTENTLKRTIKLKNGLLSSKYELCIERMRYFTEIYKKYPDDPEILKRAKAIAHTLNNMTIFIRDDELLVGNETSKNLGEKVNLDLYSYDGTLDNRRSIKQYEKRKIQPFFMKEDEINEYLVALARDPKSPSRSSFKHMVYGLRYYYRLLGMNKKAIALPSLRADSKLPVILNRSELKELFAAPTLLKQRIVLTLIYSAGLRGQEVINLKISDVDFERKTIHIRQSKYKKDRIHSMRWFKG